MSVCGCDATKCRKVLGVLILLQATVSTCFVVILFFNLDSPLTTDCDERKLKGVMYFQAIEEVYYDHLRTATSVSWAMMN